MESLQFKGQITTTSNKQSEDFVAKTPSKTAYVTVTNEVDRKKLQKFGLTLYSSVDKETKKEVEFFIIKLSQSIKLYKSTDKTASPVEWDCKIEDKNFQTNDEFVMNLIKGNKANNDFVRITAILMKDSSGISYIEAENPFANIEE